VAFARQRRRLSAIGPIATFQGVGLKGRDVPIATDAPQQTASLFDHLIGTGVQS